MTNIDQLRANVDMLKRAKLRSTSFTEVAQANMRHMAAARQLDAAVRQQASAQQTPPQVQETRVISEGHEEQKSEYHGRAVDQAQEIVNHLKKVEKDYSYCDFKEVYRRLEDVADEMENISQNSQESKKIAIQDRKRDLKRLSDSD